MLIALSETAYSIIAICVVVALVIIFFVSYVLNKKTPIPKECEDIEINNEKCQGCKNISCPKFKEEGDN